MEVKCRANGTLTRVDIGTHYPHPTAFIVLVSPYRIQCVTAGDLNNAVELRWDASDHLFADRTEFAADRHIVYQFVELASKLFQFDAAQR